jgi:hypothetical protein
MILKRMFKLLVMLVLLLTASFSYAIDKLSINPPMEIQALTALYDGYKMNGNTVHASRLIYKNETVKIELYKQDVSKAEFENIQNLAQGVFETTSADGNSVGSSVYLGNRFILTNFHVYDKFYGKSRKCRNFSVKGNSQLSNKVLYCKKVHHCNKKLDYCLIEMKDRVIKKLFSKKKKVYSLLTINPIEVNLNPNFSYQDDFMAIGNPRGKGIHYSKGYGLRDYIETKERVMFFSPVFKGSSGGALLNDSLEFIALVQSQSKEVYGLSSYNMAVPLELIYSDLEEMNLIESIRN